MPDLTHHESHVLALVLKWQPTTVYFVRKALERGLASSVSGSPGSIYAIVDRLKRRGLVDAEPDATDGRGTERLSCTIDGEIAVRRWVTTIAPADLLPEDPWRTRMALAGTMSDRELLDWLSALQQVVRRQLDDLRPRNMLSVDTCDMAALDSALLQTEARLAWVERSIARLVSRAVPDGDSARV